MRIKMQHITIKNWLFVVGASFIMAACGADGNDPGTEYAPNMYHSVPYDPLKQITEESAGRWVNAREDKRGEYYNSNPYNPYKMNMREPAANTVPRNDENVLPYRIPADSISLASTLLSSPLDSTEQVLQQGQVLYASFCQSCHGGAGAGDGPVGKVYRGVPSFQASTVKNLSEGHIFHVITYGIRRMSGYGTQLDVNERWKIVKYVQTLQNQ
ncbi:MAG: c-type cytochrome [Cyclobacteriaceae bacterium]